MDDIKMKNNNDGQPKRCYCKICGEVARVTCKENGCAYEINCGWCGRSYIEEGEKNDYS